MRTSRNQTTIIFDGESGFSILEMLVAIVVTLFGLVSVVAISIYVSKTNSVSNQLNVLASAAQDQVDRLRTAAWTRTTEDPMLSVGGSLGLPEDSVDDGGITDETELTSEQDSDTSTMQSVTETSEPMSDSPDRTTAYYTYVPDPDDPHRASLMNTPAGDLIIRWQVRQGPTPDIRFVSVRIVQENAPANMRDGFTVSTMVVRN